jgi:Rad3-related DNA helicase
MEVGLMESPNENQPRKSKSRPLSFRLHEEELEALERDAGRQGVAASELARTIVLERHKTSSWIHQAQIRLAEFQQRESVLSQQLAELTRERDGLLKAREAANQVLAEKEKALAEAVRNRDHLQEEARAAQTEFRAKLKRFKGESETVLRIVITVFGVVLAVSVCALFIWFGVAVGQSIGQFFAVYYIRSVFSGVVLFVGLGVLAWMEIKGEWFLFFPAVLILFIIGALLGLIWVGVFWGLPAPDYGIQ